MDDGSLPVALDLQPWCAAQTDRVRFHQIHLYIILSLHNSWCGAYCWWTEKNGRVWLSILLSSTGVAATKRGHYWNTCGRRWSTGRCAAIRRTRGRLFACLSQLMRFCQRYLAPAQFTWLASLPWNHFLLAEAVASGSDKAVQPTRSLNKNSQSTLKSCGRFSLFCIAWYRNS